VNVEVTVGVEVTVKEVVAVAVEVTVEEVVAVGVEVAVRVDVGEEGVVESVEVNVKVAVGLAGVVGLSFFLQAIGRIDIATVAMIKAGMKRFMDRLDWIIEKRKQTLLADDSMDSEVWFTCQTVFLKSLLTATSPGNLFLIILPPPASSTRIRRLAEGGRASDPFYPTQKKTPLRPGARLFLRLADTETVIRKGCRFSGTAVEIEGVPTVGATHIETSGSSAEGGVVGGRYATVIGADIKFSGASRPTEGGVCTSRRHTEYKVIAAGCEGHRGDSHRVCLRARARHEGTVAYLVSST